MPKKCHQWTRDQELKLIEAVETCEPLFRHFEEQSNAYTKLDTWDAVAGRMLPEVVVTGAACKRRFDKLMSDKLNRCAGWDELEHMVNEYERDLAEVTFDGVSEILGSMATLFDAVKNIKKDIENLKNLWR